MTHFYLVTWNTQGTPSEQAKVEQLNAWLAMNVPYPLIAFIQEGGNLTNPPLPGWNIYPGETYGAKVERCTNYILVPSNCTKPVQSVKLVDRNDNLPIAGGEAGRGPAAVAVDNTLFVSWHSVASKRNDDTVNLIKLFEQNPAYHQYPTIIIGGDFNTDPQSLNRYLTPPPSNRPNLRSGTPPSWKYPHRYIAHSGESTHFGKRERELDFFLLLSQTVLTNNPDATGPRYNTPTVTRIDESDHDCVVMGFWNA